MPTERLTSPARRAAILDAAVRLFSEKGFRGVTTRELAAAIGVSEPVLYQHFATKRDLFHAIIEERAVDSAHAAGYDLDRVFEGVTDDRAFLVRLAQGIIDWHTGDPTYARLLMFSALEQHELSQMFISRYSQRFIDGLARFFERRIAEGAFRPINPLLAAHMFIGLAANHGMSRAIFQHCALDLPENQLVEGFVDIFLKGMNQHS